MSLPTQGSKRRAIDGYPWDAQPGSKSFSAPRKATRPPQPQRRTRPASFPVRESNFPSVRRKSGWSGARWLRLVAYAVLGYFAWSLAAPRIELELSERERSYLLTAKDIAAITHDFVPVPAGEHYEKRTRWLRSTALSYTYDSQVQGQPRIAVLVETQSDLYRKFAESKVLAIMEELDWRNARPGAQGMVAMEHGNKLGDESESYFLYEDGKPVGNLVTLRVGKTTLSLVLGGTLLRDASELENLLKPVIQTLRVSGPGGP